MQRLIISINLERLLLIHRGETPEPLRLLVQGTAGTGKTYVIKAISFIARRLRQRNNAVLNLAPTGTASLLLPGGRTVHSTTPPLSKSKTNDLKSAQMSDYPLKQKALKKLRETIGYKGKELELTVLNMDERSMFSKRLLGWTSERFSQVTNNYDHTFGAIPIVNYFGDLGQLGPVKKLDLHIRPAKNAAPDELAGFTVYRNFHDVILLHQTMRQKESEKMFLERLLRIRGGTITQQDWLAINDRYEKELPKLEKVNYEKAETTITLHETWREVNKENRENLAKLNAPVAIIPSTGRGYHHKKGDKQVGQIAPKAMIAVNSKVILTKNQKAFTPYGLHNGAVGIVKAILYKKGASPPEFPEAVIVYFPKYTGPPWDINNPKFVPITAIRSKCESECCSRTGLPLMPGYSLPIAKAQGITVGKGQPAEYMRVKIQEDKYMEQQSLGITYTALSRAESDDRWCLINRIPQDRLMYINNHPQIENRRNEEKRLDRLSEDTIKRYEHLSDKTKYLELLQEFDMECNDGMITSVCTSENQNCSCVFCSIQKQNTN